MRTGLLVLTLLLVPTAVRADPESAQERCPDGVLVVPACAAYEDCNGPLLIGDPLLDEPFAPGCFVNFEFGLLKPHLRNGVNGQVTIPGFAPFTVAVPQPPLAWTGAPRIELGYRFPEAFGEFILGYRVLVSDSCGCAVDTPYGPARFTSRLDLHSVDLDYGKHERGLGPDWDIKWRVGVRLASVYFDANAQWLFEEQQTTNHFLGVGPHVGLELWRSLGWRGFSLFGRSEGAVLLGRVHQSFLDAVVAPGLAAAGLSYVDKSNAAPMLQVQAGLAWAPWDRLPLRLSAGYSYEVWWLIGQTTATEADLYLQGLFLRGEWKY